MGLCGSKPIDVRNTIEIVLKHHPEHSWLVYPSVGSIADFCQLANNFADLSIRIFYLFSG